MSEQMILKQLYEEGVLNLGSKKVFLHSSASSPAQKLEIMSFVEGEEGKEKHGSTLQHLEKENNFLFGANGRSHESENGIGVPEFAAETSLYWCHITAQGY
ncbi:hypothetical protein CJ030_MR4G023082 [Morella rubra]|uniref:Uncharacterized protein n=1 Tax=Morella rubra TaxID=262757 RepID=A0A6A1VUW8_9ROSI|nr:hypothetical protein CJ030_MR4G023082 [Morella rubra]